MGAQLLLISFATRLHGICNGSNNGMEDGGGSTHATALGLGISAPTPNFRVLFGTGRGNSSVFLPNQTTGDFKIPSFASPGHTRSPVCANPNPNVHIFLSSNQGCFFFIVLTASGGGLMSLSPPPPPPPPGPALYMTGKYSVPVSG